MSTVLITGSNRGIGLEFTKQYAEAGWQVLACCRLPTTAHALSALATQHSNISIHALDIADFVQVDALAQQLNDVAIDVLINNAGVYPSGGLSDAEVDNWLSSFKVNSIAPLKMATAFTHHIVRSKLKKLVTLTSKMGSINDNTSGGSYMYRSTKAAANSVMKSLSVDLKQSGIAVATLHPGWVETDMGGPNALINVQTSVTGLCKVINALNLDNTGRFLAYDGKEIPW